GSPLLWLAIDGALKLPYDSYCIALAASARRRFVSLALETRSKQPMNRSISYSKKSTYPVITLRDTLNIGPESEIVDVREADFL
ncbi:MAG: hypothetical protein WCA37_16105, partial [Terracidiphilus sp.]